MELLFLGIVIFLFLLAVFDLSVGVSNDAVNFLSSAIGSRAASFKQIVTVAAIGVFIGAAMSNGMMDVARHGIFRPENLSFYDVIAIFMAVMVTDVILLDIFNSLGMPTSTTVSLVFELLGATFVVALFKIAAPENTLGIGDLLNTEKALSVILGIFLSVGIAFVFGTIVQFLARLIFTFEYKSRLKWKVEHLRRHRLHRDSILHAAQGHQGSYHHDTGAEGMDRQSQRADSRHVFRRLYYTDASSVLVQGECLQGGRYVGNLLAGDGLCRQ